MTSHPKDLSDDLILAMKECDKVCGHMHLPLQSGSSRILKVMNRHYDKEKPLTKTLTRKDFLFCDPPEVIIQSKH
jgi:tRNA-2-methylthio-N6-dimethylallyladenosine synthase